MCTASWNWNKLCPQVVPQMCVFFIHTHLEDDLFAVKKVQFFGHKPDLVVERYVVQSIMRTQAFRFLLSILKVPFLQDMWPVTHIVSVLTVEAFEVYPEAEYHWTLR